MARWHPFSAEQCSTLHTNANIRMLHIYGFIVVHPNSSNSFLCALSNSKRLIWDCIFTEDLTEGDFFLELSFQICGFETSLKLYIFTYSIHKFICICKHCISHIYTILCRYHIWMDIHETKVLKTLLFLYAILCSFHFSFPLFKKIPITTTKLISPASNGCNL